MIYADLKRTDINRFSIKTGAYYFPPLTIRKGGLFYERQINRKDNHRAGQRN